MSALLLALILTIVLDQGSRSQRTTSRLGDGFGATATVSGGIVLAVIGNAALGAIAGRLLAGLMPPDARLLFFAITLLLGGSGLLLVAVHPSARIESDAPAIRSPLHAIGVLALGRASENTIFAIAGVAAFTQAPLLTTVGAIMGGLAALLPALFLGRRYRAVMPLGAIAAIAAMILTCIGIACAASAMGLLGR